jgi:hemerythrin superfamily protein
MTKRNDIFDELRAEHEQLAILLDRIASGGNGGVDVRRELFPRLRAELIAHGRAEEAELYAALERHDDTSELAAECIDDHRELEELLGRLDAMRLDDDEWPLIFEDLKESVEQHVDDEEGEVFPTAQRTLDADELGGMQARFLARKRDALEDLAAEAPRPGADTYDSWTKDELYQLAREKNIIGRSHMSKRELIREIRRH